MLASQIKEIERCVREYNRLVYIRRDVREFLVRAKLGDTNTQGLTLGTIRLTVPLDQETTVAVGNLLDAHFTKAIADLGVEEDVTP